MLPKPCDQNEAASTEPERRYPVLARGLSWRELLVLIGLFGLFVFLLSQLPDDRPRGGDGGAPVRSGS